MRRAEELGYFVGPGKPAAVVRIPGIGLRLFDGVELDVHVQHAAAAPQAIRLYEAGQLFAVLIEQAAAGDDFAEGGGGDRRFDRVGRHDGIDGRFVGVAIGVARLLLRPRQPQGQLLREAIAAGFVLVNRGQRAGRGVDDGLEELVPQDAVFHQQ